VPLAGPEAPTAGVAGSRVAELPARAVCRTGTAAVGRTPGLLARLVHGRGACTSLGRRPPDLCARLQDGGGSALRGRSVASGGRAFLASPWSSSAVDGDGG
jgi:hypothetical protein